MYINTLFLQAILRVSHAKQALLILQEHLGSPPDYSGVHVAPVFRIMFCRSAFVSFDHCVGYASTIYGFWLPLWYLQTFLASYICISPYCIVFFFLRPLFTALIILDYFMIILLYIVLFTSLLLLFWIISWLYYYTLLYLYHYYYYFHLLSILSKNIIAVEDPYQGGGVGFLLTSLIPPHVYVYPKP